MLVAEAAVLDGLLDVCDVPEMLAVVVALVVDLDSVVDAERVDDEPEACDEAAVVAVFTRPIWPIIVCAVPPSA